MTKLLKGEKTDLIKGFKKGEKTFDAKLEWKDNKINFVFENYLLKEHDIKLSCSFVSLYKI